MSADTLERAPEEEFPGSDHRPSRWRAVVWLPVVAVTGWAAVRLVGGERGLWMVQGIAFTPYVAAASVVVLLLALAARRWIAVAVATVAAFALVGGVLPRALPVVDVAGSGGPAVPRGADGPALRLLTSNLLFGGADAATVVRLVRDLDVDVLALQEYTVEGERALEAAGLRDALPYRVARPDPGASGSALYSRTEPRDTGVRRLAGGFFQARATVEVPGGLPVALESVHPCAPIDAVTLPFWRSGMAAQPRATPSGRARILFGDFNATLDHGSLRRLIGTGYRDAADVVGAGFTPTWPYLGNPGVPGVTIDHVLADRRIGVRRVSVHPVPGSDHRAVFAELVLPAG